MPWQSARWLAVAFIVVVAREVLHAIGESDTGDSFNKLIVFPVLVEARLLVSFLCFRHGDEWSEDEKQRTRLRG